MPAPKAHLAGCLQCQATFVCGCARPARDDHRCNSCISGIASLLAEGFRPRPCCATEARPPSQDEKARYRLAGAGPWWMCRTCKRAFIYDPGGSP